MHSGGVGTRHADRARASERSARTTDRLTEAVTRLARQHRVPGAQLAWHQDGRTHGVAVGEQEHATGRELRSDSAVPIGSVGKMFTATTAMALVADDDLDLDEPVGAQLPELARGAARLGDRLTLRQLLSHTSGLPSSLADRDAATSSLRRYVADRIAHCEPVCSAGAGFSYSNLGFLVAGRLIEVITGMSWFEAVESVLLRPLDIPATFVVSPNAASQPGHFAAGHTVNTRTGEPIPVAQTMTPALAPAGALAMSARDLVAFGRLHLRDAPPGRAAPLDADAIAEMRRAVPGAEPFGMAHGWGLGVALFGRGSTRWLGHDGTADGTSCHLRVDPAGGCVVALTTNANTGAAMWEDLVPELAAVGLDVGMYTTPLASARPVPLPTEYFGRYVNGGTEYSVLAARAGQPQLAVSGEVYPGLTLYERGDFAVRHPASDKWIHGGRFVTDPRTGRIDGLQTGGRIARRERSPS
ncbi:serine hydrolase domain-containing protein [Solihabitans fulvus]|nr:serine hydrolase domain-containing protein [Solihabitans fulvus]